MPPISFVPDRLRCSAASKSDLIVYYRHFPCARPKGPIVWSTPTGPVARRSRKSSPLSFAADHSNEEIGPQVARPASTDDGVARSADGGSTPTSAGAPSPPKVGFGPVRWHRLLRLSHKKVLVNVWPLLVVHLLCDTLVFMLHRTSHRVTNERKWQCLCLLTGPHSILAVYFICSSPAAIFQAALFRHTI